MKPVFQDRFYDKEKGLKGNCMHEPYHIASTDKMRPFCLLNKTAQPVSDSYKFSYQGFLDYLFPCST